MAARTVSNEHMLYWLAVIVFMLGVNLFLTCWLWVERPSQHKWSPEFNKWSPEFISAIRTYSERLAAMTPKYCIGTWDKTEFVTSVDDKGNFKLSDDRNTRQLWSTWREAFNTMQQMRLNTPDAENLTIFPASEVK